MQASGHSPVLPSAAAVIRMRCRVSGRGSGQPGSGASILGTRRHPHPNAAFILLLRATGSSSPASFVSVRTVPRTVTARGSGPLELLGSG